MKLSEVQFRDKMPTGAPGDMSMRFYSSDKPQASCGWALDFESGMVTAKKGEQELLIPVGNVAYMRPEPKVAKAAKSAA